MIKIIMDLWNNSTNNFMKYATEAYTNTAIGQWFYPILFVGIIGYIYAYMKSAVVAMVAILIIMGIYSSVFVFSAEIPLFMDVLVILIFVVMITLLIINPRK